uniref:Uncharacterized protein n=1 Tax=Cacopsylla melanoneura TaxID=428564 RepID=A0A8D8ZKS5_9HEMI
MNLKTRLKMEKTMKPLETTVLSANLMRQVTKRRMKTTRIAILLILVDSNGSQRVNEVMVVVALPVVQGVEIRLERRLGSRRKVRIRRHPVIVKIVKHLKS